MSFPETKTKKEIIVISCGGTGGHILPGVSLGTFLEKYCNYEILYLISDKKITKNFFKEDKLHRVILSEVLYRKILSFSFVRVIKNLLRNIKTLKEIYLSNNVKLVISAGSGAGILPVLLSKKYHIPSVLMEQNVIMGKANKILLNFAQKVFLSFPCSNVKTDSKVVVTGNPLREDLLNSFVSEEDACKELGLKKDCFTVLFIGGSQGAKRLNEVALLIVQALSLAKENFQVIHLTGESNYQICQQFYQKNNVVHFCQPFSDKMKEIYSITDIAVSRSGGGCLSELIHFNIPVISIPFPYASNKHQHANADFVVNHNGGWLYDESDLIDKSKIKEIVSIICSKTDISVKRDNLHSLSKINTFNEIKKHLDEIIYVKPN